MSPLMLNVALLVAAPATKEAPKKDGSSLVGEWAPTQAIRGGKPDMPPPGTSIVFTPDDKVLLKEGKQEKPEQGTYKIDAKKDAAEIHILPLKGEGQSVVASEGQVLYRPECDRSLRSHSGACWWFASPRHPE